jgi:hypothetical protein
LEEAVLDPPPFDGTGSRVEWLEVSPSDGAPASSAALTHAAQWRSRGWATNTHVVRGPAFWQTSEVEDAPALLEVSLKVLTGEATPSEAVFAS